MLKWLTFSD